MKKFTRILICLMLCVFTLGVVGCDSRTNKEKAFTYPKASDEIYGNGGLSVRKGKYVYFVNGYKSVSALKNSNKNDKYTVGSLMLTKLDKNGNAVTEENGAIKDDYYISMSKRLCGYEATDLFIHGDYLYFVSPILENEQGDEVWAKERVVFYRIKLDKTSKVEEVYRSNVKLDSLEYKYYETINNLYILVYEKGQAYYDGNDNNALVRVNATKKTSKVCFENVSSVILADKADEIFFVHKDTEDDDADDFDVKRYDILSNEATDFMMNLETELELTFVGNEQVFFTQTHENNSESYTDLMVSTFEGKNPSLFLSNVKDYDLSITNDQYDNGYAVVLVKDNVISLVKTDQDYSNGGAEVNTTIQEEDDVTAIDIIDYTNGCILYYTTTSSSSSIKLVSYSNALANKNIEATELTSISKIDEDYAYFDLNEEENCLYFYKLAGKTETEYYLHRIKVNNNFDETESLFGVYKSGDAPEVVEEETEVEEE